MFSAMLDTCVLVPSLTRDVLLEIAVSGVYRPLWSSKILDELARTVRRLQLKGDSDAQTTDTYVARLVSHMGAAFPDARVEGWEPFVTTIELPDRDDRHVVAAAVIGRADVIVTDNAKHFPIDALPRPLFTQTSDAFLVHSLDLYPSRVLSAVDRVAQRSGRHGPSRTSADIARMLGDHGRTEFAAALRAELAP